MSSKNFKDNTVNIDRFFSNVPHPTDDTQMTHGTQKPHNTQTPHSTHQPYDTQKPHQPHYRINLRLRPECKEHLEEESWKARKSITEYLNDLIQEDMRVKGTTDT